MVTITQLPEQTQFESMQSTASGRVDAIEGELEGVQPSVDYSIEGHVCRDVAFDILQTARDDEADFVVMGYPEDHPEIATEVQYKAPCDVLYAHNLPEDPSFDVVNLGAGGGPHHQALLPLVNDLGREGSLVNLVRVTPSGESGTDEPVEETLELLAESVEVAVHEIDADLIAAGLVDAAAKNGGVLFIGATRTRELRRWVLGSTPDRVIERADDVPVVVYASSTDVVGRARESLFQLYRYVRKVTS
jgi:nucleotide-binding universal stress UspA family protein